MSHVLTLKAGFTVLHNPNNQTIHSLTLIDK